MTTNKTDFVYTKAQDVPIEKRTGEALRTQLISGLVPYVEEYLDILSGAKDKHNCGNPYYVQQAMEITKDIVKSAGDLKIIEAQNATEVLKLLKTGKITIQEAKDLMEIMASKTNIDIANELMKPEGSGNETG